ncbi:MAG: polysaccharide biosynthesis/export family protein [Pseudomonadota bacterium]
MRNDIYALFIIGVTLLIASCASAVERGSPTSLPIPDSTTSVTIGDLRIGPMDLVQMEVFGVGDLDGTYQVDFDGEINVPLIGNVSAVGYTPGELAAVLEERYGEQFLQDPEVNVSIVESVGRRITLDGAVSNPGLYDIRGSVSLLQAVALGGGPSSNANPRKVVVFRQIEGQRHAAAFDLVSIRKGDADDPEIFGNDIIVVDGSGISEGYQNTLRSIPLIALFLAL